MRRFLVSESKSSLSPPTVFCLAGPKPARGRGFGTFRAAPYVLGERLTDAVLRVARDELGVEVAIDQFLGYLEYPGYLYDGQGWPVGLAFMVHLAASSVEGFRPKPDSAGWFEHLPDGMHEEQKGFLQAQHLRVRVSPATIQSCPIPS